MACRLYLLTPPAFDPAVFADSLKAALDAGDVAALQIRLDPADAPSLRRAVETILPIAHARDVAVLLDGRPELAAALGVDGVHLDGDGPSCAEARRRLGADAMIGIGCGGSRHHGMVAAELGADYVSFGAFFPSSTRPDAALADPEIIAWWSELMEVPCVAVGGITPGNCRPLVEAGADFVAASAGVWRFEQGPAAAVRAFTAAFAHP